MSTVESEAEAFRAPAEVAGMDLALEITDNINIRTNEKNIRQLVSILLDNAIKYATENTTIKLSLTKKGKKACLRVYNRADGITKGDNDILFERFYRNDASRNSDTGGSGIGLSIAHSIATASGAQIKAYSEDGKSIVFSVTFHTV